MTAAPSSIVVGQAILRPWDGVDGAVRIAWTEGRIESVEPVVLEADDPSAGLIALPAPANAHDHGRGLRPLAVGALDDRLELWIPALMQEPVVDPYLRAAVAFARMAEGGAGLANHCHGTQIPTRFLQEAEAVSRAALDVGVRVAFGVPIMNRNSTVYGSLEPLLDRLSAEDRAAFNAARRPVRPWAEVEALVEQAAEFEHEFFRLQYHPVGPQWVDDETMAAIAEASAATGRRVHLHLLETIHQREWADAAYPDGLVRRLDEIGLLSPRLSIAHGVWLRDDECELLGRRGVILSVNPSSNLRLRSGVPAPPACRAGGLAMGVGLDGAAIDDDEDLLRETRLFWRLARGFAGHDGLTQSDVFQSLCTTGRLSIQGDDGGGAIAVGAPADLLVLDLKAMFPDDIGRPVPPMDLLLTRMTKAHIRRLIVGGREVVRDARCVSVDLPGFEARLHVQARDAAVAAPVDLARVERLQAAIADFYRCGQHRAAQAEPAQ
jgi:cytosine/adenosine deaminase-related metal-dependent hydrolase